MRLHFIIVAVNQTTTQFVTFDSLQLEAGELLAPVTLAYETYGTLNAAKSNAVFVFHALTGDAHAAGTNAKGEVGWWDDYIGPEKAIDTNRFFVICANVIGGCRGSTGPYSINPSTDRPYALSFPIITIKDMVEAQKYLLDHLGIERLHAMIGGSMGGMQALQWSISYPQMTERVICIASCPFHSPQQIAWNEIGRQAIMADPHWNHGDWYDNLPPTDGLAVARMIGHITYLSEASLERKFSRRLQDKSSFSYHLDTEFAVESYLHYQGRKFVDRFDANSYLYITRAVDYFDLRKGFRSLQDAFAHTHARFLFISFSSDWLYPSSRMDEMAYAVRAVGRLADHAELSSPNGHDSFLLPDKHQSRAIASFLQ